MLMRLLFPLTAIYFLMLLCGYAVLALAGLPSWPDWSLNVFLFLGGFTAMHWYSRKYGKRHAILLLAVCGCLSYAAEWISRKTSIGGQSLYGEPLLFGVPLAVPFIWYMLLMIAKAFAPVRTDAKLWKGLAPADAASPDLRNKLLLRKLNRRKQYILPALWGATMAAAVFQIIEPVVLHGSYSTSNSISLGASPLAGAPIIRWLSWWIAALLILCIINYLNDEISSQKTTASQLPPLIPLMLLIMLESMFLTISVHYSLWSLIMFNLSLLALLFVWRASFLRKPTDRDFPA